MKDLHVVFCVGDTEFALPAADVLVMETFSGVTAVPGSPAWVAGLARIRGEVVPVIDLRKRFGLSTEAAPAEGSIDRRIVVVRAGQRHIGLLVDRAREVTSIAPEQLREPPEAIARASTQFIRAVAEIGDRLLMLVDSGQIANEKTAGEEASHGQ